LNALEAPVSEETTENAQDREIALASAHLALDRKAREVKLVFVGDRLGIADYFVLATVNNRRQARAVRDAVRVGLKELGHGVPVTASEDPEGRWSLYDYGGVVLHLFDDEGREYFDLDSLWDGVLTILVTEEGDEVIEARAPAPEFDSSDDTDDFDDTGDSDDTGNDEEAP
jgi:ribosome silencing factor RsfS/YbeB/iojap